VATRLTISAKQNLTIQANVVVPEYVQLTYIPH